MSEALTPAKVRDIVEAELIAMPAKIAERARRYLVDPYPSERPWAYGPEIFQCWMVLVDDEENSDTAIAFCPTGISKPEQKWVLLSADERSVRNDVGQDSSWFSSLEGAFCDSFMFEAEPVK